MSKKKIWLSSPHMSEEGYELEYVHQAFETNWIAPLGPNVTEFENEISNFVGTKAASATVTGTAALHLALKAVGVRGGDVVFCQSLTFSATANPIIYENAIPVFIDSDLETWNMDPEALEAAFKKHSKVKAVIVVHLYGIPANIDKILEICNKYNTPLIEDAAESLGSYYKGRHTGTFGEYGIFSFNGNKIITSSGGGMIVSDDVERIEKTRFWATQARDIARHYQHSELGYNYRMSNVVAGIGRGQLKILSKRVEKKRYIFEFYKKNLNTIGEIQFMPVCEDTSPNYWLSCLTLQGMIKPIDIIEKLESENIESRPLWKPMHLQPFFKDYSFFGSDISGKLFEQGMCLPSDTKMTDEDLELVCSTIKSLWE